MGLPKDPKTGKMVVGQGKAAGPLQGGGVGGLFTPKGPSFPPFVDQISEFLKGLTLPAPPEPSATGIAPPPGLAQAQLKAQTMGTAQLSGGPINPLVLPDF